jgi:hypothetical protein
MNRDETQQLLRRRRQLTNESLSDATIEAWLEALTNVDYAAGVKALTAAARTHGTVGVGALIAALPKPAQRVHTDPIGAPGCSECDGTGLSPRDEGDGVLRYGCCRSCRG